MATKGIAAISVLIYHCTMGEESTLPLGFSYLGVALFFFWSGYGMVRSADKKADYLKGFWKQRLTKLFVPFIVAAIFYYIVKKLLGVSSTITGIKSIIQGELVDNSWYVFALLAFMGLFYGWQKLFDQKKRSSIFAVIVGVVILTALEYLWGKSDSLYWTYSNLAFLLGIFVWRFDPSMKFRKWYLICLPIVGFVFYVAHPGFNIIFGHYSNIVMVLSNNGVSACVVLLVLTVLSYFGKPNPVALFLGKYSYEIYLIHGLIITLVKRFTIFDNFCLNSLIVIVVSVLVSIPLHMVNAYLINLILRNKTANKELK